MAKLKNGKKLEKKYRITPKEMCFLGEYIKNNYNKKLAYKALFPENNSEDNVLSALASKYYRRITDKINIQANFTDYLDLLNVGYSRLAEEIDKGLNSMKTEFYKGHVVAECEDNTTRQRARELLADVLGAKKQNIKIEDETDNPIYDEMKKLTKLYNEPEQEAD
jgi:hypothetical protein